MLGMGPSSSASSRCFWLSESTKAAISCRTNDARQERPVVVGVGPELISYGLFQLRLFPIAGWIETAPRIPVMLGSPLANGLAAIAFLMAAHTPISLHALAKPLHSAIGPLGIITAWMNSANSLQNWLRYVASCNACIGISNLLPIYPLDGSRILSAILKRESSL